MSRCFDESVLQSYVDDELSTLAAREISLHLAACERCRALIGEIESEMQFFAAAFDMKTPIAVPSEALRARLAVRLAETKPANPVADEALKRQGANQTTARHRDRWAIFGASLPPWLRSFRAAPQFAVAVLALVFVGASAFVAWRRSQTYGTSPLEPNPPVVAKSALPIETSQRANDALPFEQARQNDDSENTLAASVHSLMPSSSPRTGARMAQTRGGRGNASRVVSVKYAKAEARAGENYLIPGEQNYLRVITALRTAIKDHGENLLSPQARIEYERNLAVVDRAILETRAAAKAHPKDVSVRDFMYAAYQSKIELLSSVAEQTQSAALALR